MVKFSRSALAAILIVPAGWAQAPGAGSAGAGSLGGGPSQAAPAAAPGATQPGQNPYGLEPFHADFPVVLTFPPSTGREYQRTRRQVLQRVVANLQGARREAWLLAMEFFWHAPEDAVEPLVEAMDAAFGNQSLGPDVVRNIVEAMGKMARPELDAPLQRALEHANTAVRQAALCSLATSSRLPTLRSMYGWFRQMDGRARTAWLRAVRTRLPDEAAELYRNLLREDLPEAVREQIVQEALYLPATQAAAALRERWPSASGSWQALLAGVLHAAGDATGTVWLREALQGHDLARLGAAIRVATTGPLGELRDDLLRLSSHPRAEVRFELAKALVRCEEADATAVYELLAGPEEPVDTRGLALRELTRRGRPETVAAMLAEVPSATGVRLQILLHLLAQSGDPRAVPLFVERYAAAPEGEGRVFLQSLAALRCEAATAALWAVFTGPERLIERTSSGEQLTTITYLPTLMLNIRGAEADLLAGYRALPRTDHRRRAAMLPILAGLANDRESPSLRAECVQLLREVLFDREELPQLRIEALNLMVPRLVTIDDARAIDQLRVKEGRAMRTLFTEWLNEYF